MSSFDLPPQPPADEPATPKPRRSPRKRNDAPRQRSDAPHHYKHTARPGTAPAFWAAVLGYAVLMLRSPHDWGRLIWPVLAFALVPGAAGVAAGRRAAGQKRAGVLFGQALTGTGCAMVCYTAIALVCVRWRIATPANAGGLLVLVMGVAAVYAVIAGLVAGLVAVLTVPAPQVEHLHADAS